MAPARTPLRDPNFVLYFAGVIGSELGWQGTRVINLYHVFLLTESTAFVGLVGLFQLIALVGLSPLGGAIADRLDRKALVQLMQALSLLVSAGLAAVTFLDVATPALIYLSVLLNTAAVTFEGPARQALLPAIVPREQMVRAFALMNPGREISKMLGPALGGALVALAGPGLMYAVDAATYLLLIVILFWIRTRPVELASLDKQLFEAIREGVGFVRQRPVIWQLMVLDLSATVFGAYRVVLPALAENVLMVGPTGYGILAAATPAGAVLGAAVLYTRISRVRGGPLVLWGTFSYGVACLALAQSPWFLAAILAATAIGASDAVAAVIRHAAVQVETPDNMRGRVTSIQFLAAGGGPALGVLSIGAVAGAVGPVVALSAGALVPIIVATTTATTTRRIRDYRLPAVRGA